MLYNFKGRIALLAAILAVFSVSIFAQVTSGNLTGSVLDATGAGIPGADVVATNTATNVQFRTTAGQSGQYRIPNLQVGTYSLDVSASGFTKTQLKNIAVDLNKTSTVNVTLQVGEASTTVEVSEAGTAIDTTTAQIATSFESRQLADLPVPTSGANSGILNLSLLNAGVATSGSIGVGSGPSVGGQRPRNNNFTIEGVDVNQKSTTGPVVTVPNDAVAEFTVLQNQFSPEFGHSSGGQFNIAVTSGTNEFHGRLYEYFENRNLNAADNLSNVSGTDLHPRYDSNRFGGQIGGPIKRNKMFFFANFEYNPLGQASIPGQIFAPTQGGYATLASIPGVNANNLGIMQKYLPGQTTAVASSLWPTVGGIAIPIGQYAVSGPNYTNYKTGIGALDYNISEKDSLRGRFIYNKADAIDNTASLPVFYTTQPTSSYAVTINEFHNFSPSLVNEFRLGYNRLNQDYPAGNFQFPGLDQFPNLQIQDLRIQLGPDPNAPQFTIQNLYQGTDNMTWSKGAHTLKFGVDYEKSISPQSFTQRARGDYEWTTLQGYLFDTTPDYLAERTLGNVIYYGDQMTTGAFINDNWKIRPNVTLNLGLRYEYQTVPYSERLQSVNAAASVPGLIQFNEPSAQTKNFMPRIGIAWSPGTSGNTSIRAGFGINYDQLFDNLGILSLPPQFQQTVTLTGKGGANFLANGGIPPNAQTGALSVEDARANTSGFIPDQRRPKSIQWNFGVQHVFAQDYTLEVRYLGTRGINLPVQNILNYYSLVNPTNALPLFYSQPSQATLNSLPDTLTPLTATYESPTGTILPQYVAAGFQSPITGFMPIGNSTYHGLATQLTRRFANGLNFTFAYTWSHNIDDSGAEVFSTATTPRRPQDFQNLRAERSNSALDHRHRISISMLYDLPYFKNRGWFMKNVVGNWLIAPLYTFQSGTWYTVQSGADANLNGDTAGDRVIINPAGTASIGSGVTALSNSAGNTVAYLADNPSARYIAGAPGLLVNGGRNTAQLNPIDDVDLTLVKRFNITERLKFELSGRAFNIFNHPQYTGGFLNDIRPVGSTATTSVTSAQVLDFVAAGSPFFNRPDLAFSSNPRTMQIVAKFIF